MSERDLSARALEPGTTIAGKYRIDGILGTGGQGIVAKATHLRLRQPVAIKLPHRSGGAEREVTARLFHEARATFRLRSEHIARIIDVDEVNGDPFIVMEYLEGTDLKQVLAQRGPLPWAEAVGLLLQAIDGLAEAHDKGIVHRDLKPSNLFVQRRPDGSPLLKVLDFGISKTTSFSMTSEEADDLTAPLRMLGTPRYVAPEQACDARAATTASDIWALGVILQEMLTAEPVFRGRTEVEVVGQILHRWPVPISLVRSDVPLEVERLILRCLQKAPEHRFRDVRELAEHLGPFAPPWASVNVDRLRRSDRVNRALPPAPSLPGVPHLTSSSTSRLRLIGAALAGALLAGSAAVAAVELTKVHSSRRAPEDQITLVTLERPQASAPVLEILDTKPPEDAPPAPEAPKVPEIAARVGAKVASLQVSSTSFRRLRGRTVHPATVRAEKTAKKVDPTTDAPAKPIAFRPEESSAEAGANPLDGRK